MEDSLENEISIPPADENSSIYISSFLKVSDPETGEVLLQQRDDQ